ncbi:hypothetical protein [Streptococcus ferus]
MTFEEAYELTRDKRLAIDLMNAESERIKAAVIRDFVEEFRYCGIRVRID